MSENTNCLEGLRCPKCKQDDKLLVWAVHCTAVTDDGTNENDDTVKNFDEEYGDKSDAECPECGWCGKWGECSIEAQKRKARKRG